VKHLWDEKPGDWPSEVPFKDPNNAIKDSEFSESLNIFVVV
jgi:hypothetical protein